MYPRRDKCRKEENCLQASRQTPRILAKGTIVTSQENETRLSQMKKSGLIELSTSHDWELLARCGMSEHCQVGNPGLGAACHVLLRSPLVVSCLGAIQQQHQLMLCREWMLVPSPGNTSAERVAAPMRQAQVTAPMTAGERFSLGSSFTRILLQAA